MNGQNVVNMITCRAGEHCLFRSFGLGGMTDDPVRITRSSVQIEVNKWFPGTIVQEVKIDNANAKGEFQYTIKVQGM